MLRNTPNFHIKLYGGELHYHCNFCGSVFRQGDDVGLIRYNHSQIDYCPYCVAYAAQDGLPQWVKNYAERISYK